jgi:hypothetical protein
MISPQVPAGTAVGQTVLGDESHGELLDASGVEALGECEVGQVGGEVAPTGPAAMPGECHDQVERSAGAWIAEIVECACADAVSSGGAVTPGTGAGREVA